MILMLTNLVNPLYYKGEILFDRELKKIEVTDIKEENESVKYCTKRTFAHSCIDENFLVRLTYKFKDTDFKELAKIDYLLMNSPYNLIIDLLLNIIFHEAKSNNLKESNSLTYFAELKRLHKKAKISFFLNYLLLVFIIGLWIFLR